MDLSEIVIAACHLEPVGIGRHHPPRDEVVERRAPQHRLLPARVHRDVAADARRVGGGGIDGEDEACRLRRVHHPLRDDPGAAVDRRNGAAAVADRNALDRREPLELFGVDDRASRRQRNRAARVPGASAAWNDREAELDATLDESAHLVFGIRAEHDERILDAPVGGVGHVRDARKAAERDVVRMRPLREDAAGASAQRGGVRERALEPLNGLLGRGDELRDFRVAVGVRCARRLRAIGAALFDLSQPMTHRADQKVAALRVVEQIVLQVRVALDNPDVAQHLEEHPRRASGATLAAKLVEDPPHRRTEQPDHDLAIGERGVVVRNLAQPRRRGVGFRRGDEPVGERVHRWPIRSCRSPRRSYAQSSTTLPLCPESIVANADSKSPNA